MSYFYTYIRAFITFYRQNIKIINFKAMSEASLKMYFEKDNLCDTFKAFIDDMEAKVDYYIMLFKYDKVIKLINSIQGMSIDTMSIEDVSEKESFAYPTKTI